MRSAKDVTLLVVEDDPHLRETLVWELKRRGFRVLSATNGRAAFEFSGAQAIDLVITDVRMDGGDGIEFVQRLQAVYAEAPPIIFMTGYPDLLETNLSVLGVCKVLPKPFDRLELINIVYQYTGVQPAPFQGLK